MTDKPEDGGPAFPHTDWIYPETCQGQTYEGMTLRDWYAGHALQALISKAPFGADKFIDGATVTNIESVKHTRRSLSISAYAYADEMLAARER